MLGRVLNTISCKHVKPHYPACFYKLKVNNKNTKTSCEICSKLTIKTPERRQGRRSGVFIVNFEHTSHLVLEFLLLTLQVIAGWVMSLIVKAAHCYPKEYLFQKFASHTYRVIDIYNCLFDTPYIF